MGFVTFRIAILTIIIYIFLVPQDRLELSRLSTLAPKASGSTNSPTVAIYNIFVARSRVELLFRE